MRNRRTEYIHTDHSHCYILNAKKTENYNEYFDNVHIILLIHVYALAKIHQVK